MPTNKGEGLDPRGLNLLYNAVRDRRARVLAPQSARARICLPDHQTNILVVGPPTSELPEGTRLSAAAQRGYS